MKKLIFIVSIAITSIVNAQCYTSLTQSQNKLLDKYGISYSSLQTRYIMSTNRIDNISDIDTKNGMIKSYNEFIKWNNGQLQIIPDTVYNKTGADYVKDKLFIAESELIPIFLNSSHKVVQQSHFDINRDNIKSIEIVEFYMSENKNCVYIFHMIFVEDMYGYWTSFTSDDNDITLDCPFCTVP